jgi:O-antigen ligase
MMLPWSRTLAPVEKAVLAIAVLSLLGTVTNLVPLSALLAIPAMAVPLLLIGRSRVSNLTFALVLMLGYFLVWTIAYHPFSLVDYGFYRRDGNVFITFAPLLLLSLLRFGIDVDRIARWFLLTASGLNAVFLAIYAVTGGTIFFHQPGIYHFLFYAHNAAGGFLAVIAALALAMFLETRRPLYLIILLVNLAGLIASDSRGSILGLLGAVVVVLILRRRLMKTMIATIVVGHLFLIPWLHEMAPPGALEAEHPAVIQADAFQALPRAHTIAIRAFYLWPRAWHLFTASPVLGTGFGSYNDLPYDLRGFEGIVAVNRPTEIIYSDSHAHHTFLHVMAETGLIGLALLVLLLVRIHSFIRRTPETGLRTGLEMIFWIAVFSSLTEHRLFTPSQMLPFTILLGLLAARAASVPNTEQRSAGIAVVQTDQTDRRTLATRTGGG